MVKTFIVDFREQPEASGRGQSREREREREREKKGGGRDVCSCYRPELKRQPRWSGMKKADLLTQQVVTFRIV